MKLTHIDTDKAIQSCLAKCLGLKDYEEIVNSVKSEDFSADGEFQTIFNRFFRVRRNDAWREAFYKIFLEVRAEGNPSFGDVLHRIYDATHRVEASFCSKMLAAIDTSRPIWDSCVLSNLNLAPPVSGDPDSRMKEIIKMYDDICRCYEEYLHTPEAEQTIRKFDESLPEYTWISSVKKLDCFLWGGLPKNFEVTEE